MTAILALITRFWKPLALVALLGALAWWHHSTLEHGIAQGIAAQKAEDDRASEDLRKTVAKLTAQNAALAAAAKAHYDSDHAATLAAAAAPVGVSQLCKPTDAHPGGGAVRAARLAQPGDAATPAPAAVGGSVLEANNGFADDRRGLLSAFAALLDDQTAVIREFQAR